MITNLLVKLFLKKLTDGTYASENYLMPAFPTINPRTATVSAKTADYTVVRADYETPKIFSNTAAGGTIVFSLPAVATAKNAVIRFNVLAAQIVTVAPSGQEKINYNGSATAGEDLFIAGTVGNYAEIFCDGVQWIVTQANGVITKAASSSVSPSVSPSTSPSVSKSPSVSPSTSPSVSVSPSTSPSASKSPSVSPSVSPSPST